MQIASCTSETKTSSEFFFSFMTKYLLSQYIKIPTRKKNTLDILITNDPNLVQDVSAEQTDMSDHDCVHIISSDFVIKQGKQPNHSSTAKEINFTSLNYNKADFDKINESLSTIDWGEMKESCSLEEFPHLFNKKVLEICTEHTPVWSKKRISNYQQRYRRSLNRRKYKLRARLHALE